MKLLYADRHYRKWETLNTCSITSETRGGLLFYVELSAGDALRNVKPWQPIEKTHFGVEAYLPKPIGAVVKVFTTRPEAETLFKDLSRKLGHMILGAN
jgi:hypothetical protein